MATVSREQLNSEHATLLFLAWTQYNKVLNRKVRVMHSLGDGYYIIDTEETPITQEMTDKVTAAIRTILDSDIKIELLTMPRDELITHFTDFKEEDKIGILKTWQDDFIPCIRCGEYIDFALERMSTNKSRLRIFELRPYAEGFVLRFPMLTSPNTLNSWYDPSTMLKMFHEYKEWARLIQVDNISKLNQIVYNRKLNDIKWVAEGLHDKKLSSIALSLVNNFPAKRVITIAGPSSSNKTTFAKRLAIALLVNGYKSQVMEMDDFYKNRVDIPYGADGLQDFESIDAINTSLLAQRVHDLLDGKKVPRRRFDFANGVGVDVMEEMKQLKPKEFLILEGIHGLNPFLLDQFGRDKVTTIYVSALTPLNIDDHHRFSTSDQRLIRRMVRDFKFRGYSPRKTLMRWTSVRMGEERNIFPYQANADHFFNSALVYELGVLSIYGKGLLSEASIPEPDEDANSEESKAISREARRLLHLLNLFYPISIEEVPHISCIREFVGGSDLTY